MKAFKLVGSEAIEINVEMVSDNIVNAFHGPMFPVFYKGKVCGVLYEREVEAPVIMREYSMREVLEMAVKESENIYHDAVVSAGLEVTKYLTDVYKELQELANLPW